MPPGFALRSDPDPELTSLHTHTPLSCPDPALPTRTDWTQIGGSLFCSFRLQNKTNSTQINPASCLIWETDGHHGPVLLQRDHRLLLQQQRQGAELPLAAQGRGGGGPGPDGQRSGAADQPADHRGHRLQPALPPAHLLLARQPGRSRPLCRRGLPLPHVPHGPAHGPALAPGLVRAAGPAGHEPHGVDGHAAGHRRGAAPQRDGRAAAQPPAARPRGPAHRGRVGGRAGPGAAARPLLALPLRPGQLLAHGPAAQPLLPGRLGPVQPARLRAHGGRLHPHLLLRAPAGAAHGRARQLPPPVPGDHAQPGQDGGHHPGGLRGLLDASPGGAAPRRPGLQVLQRPRGGEVLPAPGRGQLPGQRCGVLLPRRRDAPHLPPPPLLPVPAPGRPGVRPLRVLHPGGRQHAHHAPRERPPPDGLHPVASRGRPRDAAGARPHPHRSARGGARVSPVRRTESRRTLGLDAGPPQTHAALPAPGPGDYLWSPPGAQDRRGTGAGSSVISGCGVFNRHFPVVLHIPGKPCGSLPCPWWCVLKGLSGHDAPKVTRTDWIMDAPSA